MNAESHTLVHLCLGGDEDAWAALVDEYQGLVYGVCRLSGVTDQDADDLAQDVFVKVWMNLSSYDPQRGGLRSWIASITRNLRIDRFRRSQQDRRTDSLDEEWDESGSSAPVQQIADLRQSPLDQACSKEITAIVCRTIDEISPVLREAVSLQLLDDLDVREVSHRLRIPAGTVKSRVSRGRSQLAALLDGQRVAMGFA
jgi:RNA polymerase sigma-70 factor (ECF subfamily)